MEKTKKRLINWIDSIIYWIADNKLEAVLLLSIILVASFLRLYKIGQYMTFLGDEGRDVIIVRRLLVDFDPILIGPGTSIGNMYLGPIYYYMMAPALFLANYSPVGPAVMIALLGVVTVFFVWFVAKKWFTKEAQISIAGLVAAGLYAVSPTVITYSRSSWNPNIMPFFALLTIYSIWKLWKEEQFKWLIITGISMGFVLQSHYLGLLLVPVIGIFWLFTYFKVRHSKLDVKKFMRKSLYSFLIFSGLMSPLFIFDARHGWNNLAAIKKFFLERQTTVSARPWTSLPKLPEIINQTNSSLISAGNIDLSWIMTYVVFIAALVIFVSFILKGNSYKLINKKFWARAWQKINNSASSYFLLFIWLVTAYIGLGVYKQHVYDHYFGFFFPAPFLVIGLTVGYVFENLGKFWKTAVSLFLVYTVWVNLNNTPIKYPPNNQLQRSIEVSRKIVEESSGKKFNIAVIAERNYEGAYQYFLEKWREPVVIIDPQRADDTITDQLFVICELPEEKCDPTHNEKAEVANFGWSKVEGQWQVAGVTLYRLTHSQ